MDKNALERKENLNSDKSSIRFENDNSEINRFFCMDVPFQVTLEYCNGTEEDYVNIVTLSAQKAVLYQETLSEKNWFRTHKVPHFHDFYEFVVILEGSVILQMEENDYHYNTGTCCLINRGVCHLEYYTEKCKVLFLGLSPDFMEELFAITQNPLFSNEKSFENSEIYQFVQEDRRQPGKKRYLDFIPAYQNEKNTAYIHQMAESMVSQLLYPLFGATYQIKGQICAFLNYLSSPWNYHGTNIYLSNSSDYLLFVRITRLFEESDGRMSRTELEQHLNYSGDYLNRIVNKYAGMCLYDYGMDFCLKRAAKYLTESDETICAIAAKLQFSNRTHFYHLFKEKFGMTPKEYRRRANGQEI